MTPDELRERLAAIEHERWSDWQRYMHGLGTRQDDGHLILPADQVAQWERQIETPYDQLSEQEKDSDREQVDRYWSLIAPDSEDNTVAAPTPETGESDNEQLGRESDRVYVDVRVTAGDDLDLSRFIQLCKTIEHLSSVGASRDIRVPVDGDGSASLKFDFGETDVSDVEVPDIDDEIVIGMGN